MSNMQNIVKLKELIENHFCISKKAKLSIGIIDGSEEFKYFLDKEGLKPYQIFQYGIGSISKTVIANVLAKMIEQKEISLEDDISKYFIVTKNMKYPTILSLATHTSGYSKFSPFFSMVGSLMIFGFCRRNFYSGLDSIWIDKYVGKKRINKHRKYKYSDINYAILGRIIEKVKNDSLENIVEDYLVNEIGMKNTYFISEIQSLENSWKLNNNNPFRSSGGIASNIDDMLKFIKFQINNKDVLLNSVFKKYYLEKDNIYTCFSWNSYTKGKLFWHHGAMGYFRSSIIIDLKRDIGVIIMTDIKGGRIQRMGKMTSQVYRLIKRNRPKFEDFINSLK